MAEIITLQSAIVPILQKAAQKISDRYGGIRADDTNWMIHCPLHDDKQASCHIQVTDKLLAYCHVCGKEKQKDLIDAFKKEDLWVVIEQPKRGEAPEGPHSNIPAHDVPEVFPRYMSDRGSNHPISKIWTYHTETGHPAFWIMRADFQDVLGNPHKSVKPYSSFTIDGKNQFKFGLQCDARPLYNLTEIVNNPNKTVIMVEGEKAADAAKKLFPDYVVTTWAGGIKSFDKTNISHLINRDVILWPDNDLPGISGMRIAASRLPKSKIVFQEVQKNLPDKWDLGDVIPPNLDLVQMLQNAEIPVLAVHQGEELSLDYYKSRLQKMEWNNDTVYVDVRSRDHNRNPTQPFVVHGTLTALYKAYPHYKIEFIDGKVRRIRSIDVYIDDTSQPIAHAITFDPTTTDVLVKKGNVLLINNFLGFEHEPKECDAALYQPFIDHISGVLDEAGAVWLLDFFADMVQNVSRKPGVMPILTGKPGTGKSIIGEVITSMLGRLSATCIPCGAIFDSKFNGMLARRIFVSFDEINLYGATNRHANENLKTLVTDKYIHVNEKYKQPFNEQSFHRFMGTTNVAMPVYIDMSDRRYAVFSVGDKFLKDREHFKRLVTLMSDDVALCGLHHYFKTRQITTDIYDVPETEARQLIKKPEDPIVGMVFSILNEASLPEEISRRLIRNEWPQNEVFVPRFVMNDYIIKKHPSLSGTRIANTVLKHFKWDRPDGKYNNTKRMIIKTADGRAEEPINTYMYQLKPIHKQRQIYEEITGTKPTWSEITFDEGPDDPVSLESIKEPF